MPGLKIPTRHPEVAHRRLPLGDEQAQELQFQRGLWTLERGVKYALPFDHVNRKNEFQGRDIWAHDEVRGTYRKGTKFNPPEWAWVPKLRKWVGEHSESGLLLWNMLAVGHDFHISAKGDLFGRHWHVNWADPITGEASKPLDPTFETLFGTHFADHICDLPRCPRDSGITLGMLQGMRGFTEHLGWLSGALVTDAFVSEIVDELVSATASEFADFDFHEVGTDNTAENNDHTALQATSGIARATGSPTDSDPIYQNVGTITADATETWEEHGLFNNSTSVAMMDRSLTGGQSVNSSDQVQYTYQLTVNPET